MGDHLIARKPGALNLVLHRGPAVHARLRKEAVRSAWLVVAAGALGLAAWRGRLRITGAALVLGGLICSLGRTAGRVRQTRVDRRLDEAGRESFPASDAPAMH